MEEDQYRTISSIASGLYKEKGSKFIAVAIPVNSVEEAKDHLEKLKKEYHDARHHCYAYKIGRENPEYRFNDDGEPSGTAGKPIFGRIESYDLTHLLIVVIRYFGGVKLGTGGLIKAYKSAAQDALEHAAIVIRTLQEKITVRFPYDATNDVMRIINEEDLKIIKQDFDTSTTLTLSVRKNKYNKILDRLLGIENVQRIF